MLNQRQYLYKILSILFINTTSAIILNHFSIISDTIRLIFMSTIDNSIDKYVHLSPIQKMSTPYSNPIRTSVHEKTSILRILDRKEDNYFLPTEVATHNRLDDCWVSYHGGVYDLTELCKLWAETKVIRPILAHAGKDISHWFDHTRNDIKHYVHPVTGVSVPYCPHGPIPDVAAFVVPATTWRPLHRCPWWLDENYKKGNLTSNARPCRIINVLTGTRVVIWVCEEDTIARIRERALVFNANGASYSWKCEGKEMDYNLTLTENGILDERDRFCASGLPDDFYIPSLMCYYNDRPTNCSKQNL